MYGYDRRVSSKLKLGPKSPYNEGTKFLEKAKPVLRRRGVDFESAVRHAAGLAQKMKKSVFVYKGNSYMHEVFNVTWRSSDYLSPINNTGGTVVEVTPEGKVFKYEVLRSQSSPTDPD
jgi:hypothetical protein